MSVTVHHGDSRDVLKGLADASIDSVVCDPPYALVSIGKRFGKEGAAPSKAGATGAYQRASAGFMGKTWDTGETAFAVEFWAEVYRVLKPGGHVVAFSGTRTYHRMTCAIEDAGFEIRDMLSWLYGSGFPKSHDVSKGIDKALGYERAKVRIDASQVRNPKATGAGRDGMKGATRPWIDKALAQGFHEAASPEAASPEAASWSGWGTALKPACEPIVLARKPLESTVAANVLQHGTGALNIDGCRVEGAFESGWSKSGSKASKNVAMSGANYDREPKPDSALGRWPANVLHDGSDEVVEAFPLAPGQLAPVGPQHGAKASVNVYGDYGPRDQFNPRGDSGSAARFFYTAKADAEDRLGSKHPTIKPTDLMRWLCRLVTPPGGVILDPFAGSGSTGVAAIAEGFDAILIEREAEYIADINRRLAWARGEGRLTVQEKARDVSTSNAAGNDLPLFATQETAQPASQPASVSSTGSSPETPHRANGDDEMVAA